MQTIYLIGFMGSGKSTIGQELSSRLNRAFLDLDQQIEQSTEQSIPSIFEEGGEGLFRHYETKVLQDVQHKGAVIATGGGIIETASNESLMRQDGVIVYLHTEFATISERLQDDPSRPLWNTEVEKRKALYDKRLPVYRSWADVEVITDHLSVGEIVHEIEKVIKQS